MEDEKRYKDIELRSEEVQEVMDKVPPAILRYGMLVLAGILTALLVGSAFYSYPDTVTTEFTLTAQNPPAYLVAGSGGRIEQLYVGNRQPVRKGDLVGVIENIAKTEDVLYLREQLDRWKQSGARIEELGNVFFHYLPRLGDLQAPYSSCLLAWNNYLQHMHENRNYETEAINAAASLITALAAWEKAYLLTIPIEGTIAFMQPWKENSNVQAGETMFVVVPSGDFTPQGKALLPMQGAGKVENGQRAIVRLDGFPEQEFGFIEGRVTSISPVPDKDGKYVVEIELPHGVRTRYGKELPVMKMMTGTADIVTKEQSLLERLIKH